MKVFQVLGDFCHWDASESYSSAAEARKYFAPDIMFVEAPDYVFEGWGYDNSGTGDARFTKPTPPEGWLYDDDTGTFYQEGFKPQPPVDDTPDSDVDSIWDALAEAIREGVNDVE